MSAFASRRSAADLVSFVLPLLLRADVERLRDELERDELDRDELDRERDDDFASPFCARCLLTVRAAISFARPVERPRFFSPCLMCSYWRSRLELHDL